MKVTDKWGQRERWWVMKVTVGAKRKRMLFSRREED